LHASKKRGSFGTLNGHSSKANEIINALLQVQVCAPKMEQKRVYARVFVEHASRKIFTVPLAGRQNGAARSHLRYFAGNGERGKRSVEKRRNKEAR